MARTRADAVVGINVPVLESIFGRIRELIRSERGIAVPTALLVLVVSFGFATVALVSSTNSQSGSVRDQDTKTAISSADAGAEEALLRENKVETQSGTACVVSSAGVLTPGVPAADGWCPQHQGDVGTASFAYRVKPFELVTIAGQERRAVTVVSQGASDQVSRRIAISATAPTGIGVFGDNRAVGVDGVTIGGSSDVNTSTGSEQDVIIEENGTLCGNARHGPGAEVGLANNGQQCAGYIVNEGSQPTPPIDISEIYANNTNYRLLPTGADQRSGSVAFDPASRTLNLSGNGSLTLGGTNYLLCRLDMSGSSSLIMAAGTTVKIYFDSPENCGMGDGAEQIKVIGTSRITSTAYDPSSGSYALPGLYMLGSDELETYARFSGTGDVTNEFVLYAPRTHVEIGGTAEYVGATAGKTLSVFGTALLTSDQNLPAPDVDVIVIYKRDRYVECTGATGSPPDASC